ncbi:MAG: DOMON domain-containing protein [Pseudomonadota bacterium]
MKKIGSIWMAVFLSMVLFLFSASAMEYQHKLEVKNMQFSWTVEGENIHVMLSAETTGWVAIGFDPEDAMQGANIIIGAVKDGQFKVEDHYGDRKRGHTSDEELGGKNNVLNPSGTEEGGITTISFTLPLKADEKWDKPINSSGITRIMLAYGAGQDSFKSRHPYRTVYDIDLSTGESKKIK